MDIARSSLSDPPDAPDATGSPADPDGPATADRPAAVARVTVDGRGADRELDALAGWLRGNPLVGGGWPVSRIRPDAPTPHPQLGATDADTLGVVIQSGLGLAQLIVAVWAWWDARAAKGRSDITATVIYLDERHVIGGSATAAPQAAAVPQAEAEPQAGAEPRSATQPPQDEAEPPGEAAETPEPRP